MAKGWLGNILPTVIQTKPWEIWTNKRTIGSQPTPQPAPNQAPPQPVNNKVLGMDQKSLLILIGGILAIVFLKKK